jgi:outer membrane lipoprotein LolB
VTAAVRYWLQLFLLIPGSMLASCATLAPPTPPAEPATYLPHLQSITKIHAFELRGRIGVLTEKKGFSGLMHWHHHEEGDDIDLYSPLGSQLGQINTDADGVTLITSDQKVHHATDAETLTEQTMGWSLPLSGLNDWVLGRPAAGAMEILAWDEAGHIAHLRQNGWDIEYPQYVEVNAIQLPAKIVLKSARIDLRLVVESWQTDAD